VLENNTINIRLLENELIRLLIRKSDVEPQYNKIKEELGTINTQIAGLDQALLAAGVNTSALRTEFVPSVETEVEQQPAKLQDQIAKLLKDVGKPMHYKQIADTLIRSGFRVPGQDTANTVSAYLNRHKNRFSKATEMGRGYYQLRE